MTRAERKALRAAQQARIAVGVWAQLVAKRVVTAQIKARGEQIGDYSHKDIVLLAEAWLLEHPEMIAEARLKAAALGYALPQ
jgi:hypothetical protein